MYAKSIYSHLKLPVKCFWYDSWVYLRPIIYILIPSRIYHFHSTIKCFCNFLNYRKTVIVWASSGAHSGSGVGSIIAVNLSFMCNDMTLNLPQEWKETITYKI